MADNVEQMTAIEFNVLRPLLAGLRPSSSAAAPSTTDLHLGLLGDLQCVINLNPKIPDGAFELCVAKQELNRPQIPGPSVDQRRFGTAQRMSAVGRRVPSPIHLTHDPTIREYCRVERWGDSLTRLGKRNCSGLR